MTQAAVRRRVEPHRLKLQLTGDLDWIVMKALEKNRNRRYQTALGLGVDIRRYLDNEVVLARPPSRLYRFRKLVRRNRAVFVSVAAVSLALIAGFGTSTRLFFREREAHREAQKARDIEAQLRRQAEVQAVVAKAASLLDKYQMPQADELVGRLPLSDMATAGAPLFRPLGDWVAVRGNWRRAAEYYSALVRLDFEQSDPVTLDYTKYAVVLVETGDLRAYEEFCRDTVRQFGNTSDCVLADRIIKLCSLCPPKADLLAALVPFAELAAKSIPADAQLTSGDWPIFWRCLSLALFEYRRGDYADALHWGGRCLEFDKLEHMPPRVAGIHAISAMCYFRLGQNEQAREELGKSRALIEERSKTEFVAYDDSRGWWFDWFLAMILEREAAAMIGTPPAVSQ
jgi:hypothetical protein